MFGNLLLPCVTWQGFCTAGVAGPIPKAPITGPIIVNHPTASRTAMGGLGSRGGYAGEVGIARLGHRHVAGGRAGGVFCAVAASASGLGRLEAEEGLPHFLGTAILVADMLAVGIGERDAMAALQGIPPFPHPVVVALVAASVLAPSFGLPHWWNPGYYW
jgi:hypothetical protein